MISPYQALLKKLSKTKIFLIRNPKVISLYSTAGFDLPLLFQQSNENSVAFPQSKRCTEKVDQVDRLRPVCLLFIRLIKMTLLLKIQRKCYLFAIAIRPDFSKLLNISSLQDSTIHQTNNSVDRLHTIYL